LMVEQVECADVIVLNKADLLDLSEREEIDALVRGLNARAERVLTERSQVSSEFLLDRVRFDPKATVGAATWIQTLNTLVAGKSGAASGEHSRRNLVEKPSGAPRHEERFGISSFIFQARRPFGSARLEAFFKQGWPGLLRAKGFFWSKERPDEMGFLSLAGRNVQYDFLNYWWAALVENGKAPRSAVPPQLEAVWQEPAGDRRQEIVLIGVNLDEPALRAALETCLA
jgi:G3E family GTPase